MHALLVADPVDRELGLLGAFLQAADATVCYLDRRGIGSTEIDASVLVLLGSNRSAHDAQQAGVVASEIALIRHTLERGIPVMGICYGAQVLARALGGGSHRGVTPECGWTPVISRHEELCPPRRWGQMHHDIIVPARTSTVIGWSPAGPQAFIDDSAGARAIGWQFHPEMTLPTFERLLRSQYSGSERADIAATLAEAERYAPASARPAIALFTAAFEYLGVADRQHGRHLVARVVSL